MSDEERRQILDMLERGQVNVPQAISLLQALGEAAELPEAQQEAEAPAPQPAPAPAPAAAAEPAPVYFAPQAEEAAAPAAERMSGFTPPARWRNWWLLPVWVGAGIILLSSFLMYLALTRNGMDFWFACTWFPFLLGVLVLGLGWASHNARWLHLRVQQKPGERPARIAISLPLPLRLIAGLMRMFAPNIPEMGNANLDEMIMILEKTSPEAPLYLVVDEEDGEHVEIYIG